MSYTDCVPGVYDLTVTIMKSQYSDDLQVSATDHILPSVVFYV